jgi:hypothetical protein
MKRKTGLQLTEEYIPEVIEDGSKSFSGADMEAALTRSKFRAAAVGQDKVTPEILNQSISDFLPPTYPEEVELQTLSAIIECTSRELLPEQYRDLDRDEVLSRIEELKYRVQ